MRDAETVLSIIRDRGRRSLPLEDVYRQLFNPGLYLLAYGKIGKNAGALTPGVTTETVDGMALDVIEFIIGLVRAEKYRFQPTRRVHIPKRSDPLKKRPLGIPTWSDKLLQEAVRLILEAYYEPRFSDRSHGYRPGRGCHTALQTIHQTWNGTTWFIEGDIKGCFDNLDHEVLLDILRQDIHDGRFVRLIAGMLKAGYVEDWKYHRTLSGSPQGGVVSPILANIYLDRLDQYVEHELIPEFTRGRQRKKNPAYARLARRQARAIKQGNLAAAVVLRKQKDLLPRGDPNDTHYRRLRYLRYADDFLLGFAGPRAEAEVIKQRLRDFLHTMLKLELSAEKTLITHGRTRAARFLGYELVVMHSDRRVRRSDGIMTRSAEGVVGLKVPMAVVREKCAPYLRRGKPMHRTELTSNSALSIVAQYQSEFRGLADYYQLAYNRHRLSRLQWIMETSLTKTLASKLKISVPKVYRRYRVMLPTVHGPRTALQVVVRREGRTPLIATWGAISLARKTNAVLNDAPQPSWNGRTDLVQRLLADTCELCGSRENVQVHHIRALKPNQQTGRSPKPEWLKTMIARNRKTLVVCGDCHRNIHAGRPTRATKTITGDWRAG